MVRGICVDAAPEIDLIRDASAERRSAAICRAGYYTIVVTLLVCSKNVKKGFVGIPTQGRRCTLTTAPKGVAFTSFRCAIAVAVSRSGPYKHLQISGRGIIT